MDITVFDAVNMCCYVIALHNNTSPLFEDYDVLYCILFEEDVAMLTPETNKSHKIAERITVKLREINLL